MLWHVSLLRDGGAKLSRDQILATRRAGHIRVEAQRRLPAMRCCKPRGGRELGCM